MRKDDTESNGNKHSPNFICSWPLAVLCLDGPAGTKIEQTLYPKRLSSS
jgi:hypothetical protein